ncbi:MAG: type I DNA topoisomerase [Ruminococcaceae bacterium]|nr:type I DNA topoisomerase [Oscillospiraceae bacterium]
MANLVIVESPSKANTIKGYLGSNYKVIASKGHVRDLPKSSLGVDIENGFEAHYINIRGKGDLIKSIKKEAKNAGKVFLATDPDREGEAISWHLANALGIPVEQTRRVTFNEITKSAIKAAIKNPRQVDMNLVNAQQTRRILDRIVGYKLSPLLWKSIKSGLSAGRVQSVATRIIVEREEEIKAFVPSEYWTIEVLLSNGDRAVTARFIGDKKGNIKLQNEEQTNKVLSALGNGEFKVESVKTSVRRKAPQPPFTTSTMQQEASKKLGFQSARIMKVAQELYEGVNIGSENGGIQGLITYMRTDSLRVSAEAAEAAKSYISERFGNKYYPKTARVYKTRSGAQDAHEAIRPSSVAIEPQKIKKYLSPDQFKLYKLIWERFVASQMESAELNTVVADFTAGGYIFRSSGYTVTFPGYMAMYEESEEEKKHNDGGEEMQNLRLPTINDGESFKADKIDPAKHFTEPPARYNEASLIKFLEEKGIGRPSTYTPIITTILARNYVVRDGKALVPTPLGEVTTKLMKDKFPDIVDYKFTANMEDDLDGIEKGESDMQKILSDFYEDFSNELEKAEVTIEKDSYELPSEETDIICDKCGRKMVIKSGKFGKFAACPGYPKCRNTKPLVEKEEVKEEKKVVVADFKCEKCGADMVLRNGRYGSFYACSRYPECNFTKQKTKELDVACPKCGGKILTKYGRNRTVFYSCENYPKCDFSSWDMPLSEKCPDCGNILYRKKGKALVVCHEKDCGYKREVSADEANIGEEIDG